MEVRPIDGNTLIEWFRPYLHTDESIPADVVIEGIRSMPTLTPPNEWVSVEEGLPNVDKTKSGYEEVYVIAETGNGVRPLIFERACVRDKVVRRWKWVWGKIYDGSPVSRWMPLPEPPKEG